MRGNVRALALGAAALAAVLCAACGGGLAEKDVPYVRPMIDSIMKGIADKDYAVFSRDFSDAMKAKVGAEELGAIAAELSETHGGYREWSFQNAVKAKGPAGMEMVVVTFRILFSGKDGVEAKAYIGVRDGAPKVEGFMIGGAG